MRTRTPLTLAIVALALGAAPGDVVYFNAACPHGVAPIDPDAPMRWTSFAGRWMLLFAVNRLAGNSAIANAVALESPS